MKKYKKIYGLSILFIFVVLGTLFSININKAIAEDGGITMSVTPTRNIEGINVAVSVTWSINSGTAEGVRITLKDENGAEIKKEVVVLSGDKTQTGTLLFKASDLESSKKYKLTTEARQIARLQDQWKGITWNFNNLWSDGEDYIQGVKEKSLWELKILSIVDPYIPGRTDIFTEKTQTASNDEAIPVAAKINVPENNTVYKMLAPLGSITCMDWSTPKNPNSKCIGNNIGEYLNFIFKFLIGLCAALAVIMLIISGITYMGDESVFGKTEAKSKMFSAILGLIIALGAYALLNTINPDLTGVNGLKISAVDIQISADETSTGSSTSLCLSNNPPNPDSATGTNITLSPEMINEYIPARNQIVGLSTGTKLLITAQTAVEGFKKGTKSYRTNNPGNIGNTDNGATVPYASLVDGIKKQQSIITNVATNNAKSYKIGGKSTCALGSEVYNGSLYQYLRIYATGARVDNNYLNAIIGYFKSNGKTITARTTIADIYAIN